MGMMMLKLITIEKKYLFGAKDTESETGCLEIDLNDGRFLSTIEWQWFLSKKTIVVNGFLMVLFTSEPLLSMVFHMSTIALLVKVVNGV